MTVSSLIHIMSPQNVQVEEVKGLTNKDMKELSYVPNEVSIYFGSESGTAECFAEDISTEAKKHGITSEVLDLRSLTPESFARKKIVILVVATYGDGEPTDNAVDFATWAGHPKNVGALAGQRFCVMGLGDMNYTRFQAMGIATNENMENLGAKRIYPRGIGDDSQDIQDDFQKWKDGGLWECLRKATAEVEAEGGYSDMASAAKEAAKQPEKVPLFLFVGHEEKDGAAKDISEALEAKLAEGKFGSPVVESLSNRKACDVVKKMPKGAVALLIVDSSPEGLCSAGKKLVRNMAVELDKQGLKEKAVRFVVLTVATCERAAAQKSAIENTIAPLAKGFDRVGAVPLDGKASVFIDAGEDSCHLLDGIIASLSCHSSDPLPETPQNKVKSMLTRQLGFDLADIVQAPTANPPAAVPRTVLLCTGTEAREAAAALAKVMPRCSVEDAALVSMAGAARNGTQVVLVVDCNKDGLSDGAAGLSAQLSQAPAALQAQLRKLKFVLLTVAFNKGGLDKADIAKAVEPVSKSLEHFGANCAASPCLDLKDINADTVSNLCETVKVAFGMDLEKPKTPMLRAQPDPVVEDPNFVEPPAGTTVVRMAPSITGLPDEVKGEPADVVSRFYFEAEEGKVLKVRNLRQEDELVKGLSTVEIEVEAKGKLAEYSAGGTFQLLPENDPEDVQKMLPLLGLQAVDLEKLLTFAVGAGVKHKLPFPTPCTLGKALSLYCDLAKPPTKKMLAALQPCLQDSEAKDRLEKLLKDEETLKSLQSPALCCRMHEFWACLGVDKLDLCEFLLHCTRQKAREFTIASSSKAVPGKIALCVSLTSHEQAELSDVFKVLQEKGFTSPNAQTPSRSQRFLGIASNWINTRLKVGAIVLAKQRPSPLKLPKEDVPIIMIGAGAGVAPFKGFWDELRKGTQTAPAMLFFGCRHPDKDWLYKEEMNGAVKLGNACGALARMRVGPKRPLAALYPAFSRPDDAANKRYVQDLLREQANMVKAAMEKDGYVFLCGSKAMGKAVLEALGDILEGGHEAVQDLKMKGRIVAEMWG